MCADTPEDDTTTASKLSVEALLGLVTSKRDEKETFKIGELAKEFGLSQRAIRFYEDKGLITPERRGSQRLYSRRDRQRLRLILLAKLLGFSLLEGREVIDYFERPTTEGEEQEQLLKLLEDQRGFVCQQLEEAKKSLEAIDATAEFIKNAPS